LIRGQSNFQPCSNVFSQPLWVTENNIRLHSKLASPIESFDVLASILTEHSLLSSDNILEIVQERGTSDYYLIFRELQIDSTGMHLTIQKKLVSNRLANCLIDLFTVALIHVEYLPSGVEYTDGTHYYLRSNYWGISNNLCGYTRTPSSGKVSDFVKIIDSAVAFTKSSLPNPSEDLFELIKLNTQLFNEKGLKLEPPTMEQIMNGEDFDFFEN